jgi:endo-1,4-beta-xylanase
MGYDLIITELDVHDKGLPAAIAERDRATADLARAYLDLMLSYDRLGDILAWGMSDRYSWLQGRSPRPDGLAKRPCPCMMRLPARSRCAGDRNRAAERNQ